LKLVTISTYAGISTTTRKNAARAYLTIEPAVPVRIGFDACGTGSIPVGGADREVVVMPGLLWHALLALASLRCSRSCRHALFSARLV
jgi:hypothetical protein